MEIEHEQDRDRKGIFSAHQKIIKHIEKNPAKITTLIPK